MKGILVVLCAVTAFRAAISAEAPTSERPPELKSEKARQAQAVHDRKLTELAKEYLRSAIAVRKAYVEDLKAALDLASKAKNYDEVGVINDELRTVQATIVDIEVALAAGKDADLMKLADASAKSVASGREKAEKLILGAWRSVDGNKTLTFNSDGTAKHSDGFKRGWEYVGNRQYKCRSEWSSSIVVISADGAKLSDPNTKKTTYVRGTEKARK